MLENFTDMVAHTIDSDISARFLAEDFTEEYVTSIGLHINFLNPGFIFEFGTETAPVVGLIRYILVDFTRIYKDMLTLRYKILGIDGVLFVSFNLLDRIVSILLNLIIIDPTGQRY